MELKEGGKAVEEEEIRLKIADIQNNGGKFKMKAIRIEMIFEKTEPNKGLLKDLQSRYNPLIIQESNCDFFQR